jgi:hypothetical protein
MASSGKSTSTATQGKAETQKAEEPEATTTEVTEDLSVYEPAGVSNHANPNGGDPIKPGEEAVAIEAFGAAGETPEDAVPEEAEPKASKGA